MKYAKFQFDQSIFEDFVAFLVTHVIALFSFKNTCRDTVLKNISLLELILANFYHSLPLSTCKLHILTIKYRKTHLSHLQNVKSQTLGVRFLSKIPFQQKNEIFGDYFHFFKQICCEFIFSYYKRHK